MVNTFFCKSTPERSVKALDSRRLNKQIVEATQILNILNDAKIISSKLNIPYDIDDKESGILFFEKIKIFKNVFSEYKKKKYFGICNKLTNEYFFTLNEKEYLTKFDPLIHRKITGKGFINHPTTLSWIGFEIALQHYINLCIDEWLLRGNKLKKQKYIITQEVKYPFWCTSKPMINSHKSAVIRKEISRNEKEWYLLQKSLLKIINTPYISNGYLWITKLSEENIDKMIKKETIENSHNLCVDINNDELTVEQIEKYKKQYKVDFDSDKD